MLLLLLILSKVYYRNQPYERAAAVVVSIERDPIIAIMFDAKPCERAAAATDSVESILSQSAVQTCCSIEKAAIIAILFDAEPCKRAVAVTPAVAAATAADSVERAIIAISIAINVWFFFLFYKLFFWSNDRYEMKQYLVPFLVSSNTQTVIICFL